MLTEAESKAIEEAAKFGQHSVTAATELCSFINRVLGIEDLAGVFYRDKLRYHRAEKLLLLQEKQNTNLERKGIINLNPVPPKIAIPLIEAAAVEDNDDLHTKWANMLANARDPEYFGKIKRCYISMLSDMEPLDVLILDVIFKEYNKTEDISLFYVKEKISQLLSQPIELCKISLRNLLRLGCIEQGVVNLKTGDSLNTSGHDLSSYKGTDLFKLTLLGVDFCRAVAE